MIVMFRKVRPLCPQANVGCANPGNRVGEPVCDYDANVCFRPKADTHEAQMEISSEVKLKLNCLTVRSEDELIRWAVRAFELPSEQLPHTEYTADFTCG